LKKKLLFVLAAAGFYFAMPLCFVAMIFGDEDFLGDFASKLAGGCYQYCETGIWKWG
jgi:hypothetical protein